MNICLILGGNIQKYRSKQNISQEKLAELSGLHRTYIGSTERGKRNTSIKNVEKIAIALGVNICDLFERNDND